MLSLGAIFNKLGGTKPTSSPNSSTKGKPNGNIGSITFNNRKRGDKTKEKLAQNEAKEKNEKKAPKVLKTPHARESDVVRHKKVSNRNEGSSIQMDDKEMSVVMDATDENTSSEKMTVEPDTDRKSDTSNDVVDNESRKPKRTRYNHNDDGTDIHQHNARPQDLDRQRGALKRPKLIHELPSNVKKIFTETSFKDLSMYLPPRMVNILEGYEHRDTGDDHTSETSKEADADADKAPSVSEMVEIKNGFKLPATTKIQSVTIPFLSMSNQQTMAYKGKSIPVSNKILIKSQTGSGKTLSYLIPIVSALMKINDVNVNNTVPFHGAIHRTDGVRALILVPTRELCNQVANSCNRLTEYCCKNCVVGIVTGGEKRKSEKARIRRGIVVMIATPGRFLDHLRTTESLNMSKCLFIVLDEVDKLLELGESSYASTVNNDINSHNALNEIMKILLSGDMQTLLQNSSVDKDKKIKKSEQIQKRNTRVEQKWGEKAVLKEVEEVEAKELNISLQDKWKQQQFLADRCVGNNPHLKLVMVTATLTQLVKRMASKILINNKMQSNMVLLDGETDAMHYITNTKTIEAIGTDSGLMDGSVVLGDYTITGDEKVAIQADGSSSSASGKDGSSGQTPSNGGSGETGTPFEILHRKRVIEQQLEVNQQRGVTTADGCISFLDEDTIPEDFRKLKQKHSSLALGENIADALPEQLSQYYMVVPCKWRLAALLSFLKLHQNEKVIVFFSTCDSVDYHALLLKAAGDFQAKHKTKAALSKEPIAEGSTWPLDFDDIYNSKQNIYSDSRDNDGFAHDLHRIDEWNDYTSAGHKSHTLKNSKNSMGGNDKKSKVLPSEVKNDILEPLPAKFKSYLISHSTNFYRLHGNVPNHTRQTVYKEFCKPSNYGSILLCTDVAARGLDLPDVDWIVQYDTPTETIDYVHRIGRTARKGNHGSSLLFLMPNELPYVQLLSSHGLSSDALSLQHVFLQTSEKYMNYNSLVKTYTTSRVDEVSAVIIQKRMEAVAAANNVLTRAGKQAFRSFVRAYSTHTSDYVQPNSSNGDKPMLDYVQPFQVYNLHLGHVAKSFALTEHPKNIRGTSSLQDDIIGQIFNCYFSKTEKPPELVEKEREKELKLKKMGEYKINRKEDKDEKDRSGKGKHKKASVFEQRIVSRDDKNQLLDESASNAEVELDGGSRGKGVLDANGNEIINVKQIIADKRKYQHSAINTGAPTTQKIRAITSQSANVTKVGRFHKQQAGITDKKQNKVYNKTLSEFL